MNRYGKVWTATTAVLATVGGFVALAVWPFLNVLISFLCVAVVVAGIAVVQTADDVRISWQRVLRIAVLGGGAAVAAAGMTVLLDGVALLLVAAAIVSSPAVLRLMRQGVAVLRNGGRPESRETEEEDVPSVRAVMEAVKLPPAQDLDDRALCQAWRKSYLRLQRARNPEALLREVEARQQYLDELERRNPDGLSAWLSAGAQPAGDPGPYLTGPEEGRSQPPAA